MLIEALTLQLGYNATLVTLGAACLGAAAGMAGVFLVLRRRALVSDALAHATLPGLAAAFLAMSALGLSGRWLPGLMAGSALAALAALWAIQALAGRTRLPEDAAIGAVLSVFFGMGVVLMTVVQTIPGGQQAGLESFLLGATSGMLRAEALTIAAGALVVLGAVLALRRPMSAVAFDARHAAIAGLNPRAADAAITLLALAVTVTGLKIVGLVLIVALLIVPPATARLWTGRIDRLLLLAAAFGAAAGWIGAAASAAAADLPTGPLVVLSAAAMFALSLLVAPGRGVIARALARARLVRGLAAGRAR